MRHYDYIIAGSGLAGLYIAYHAAAYGKVALLTKSGITESNSYFAQGGIAAATDEDDAPALHFEDTIIAGRGLCDYPAVDILVNEGPQRIRELMDAGMHFDMEDGSLALGLEGGHHRKRILHAGGDATGRMVTSFMISKVINNPRINIFENHSVIGILQDQDQCYGVRTWNLVTQSEELFTADNTFLTLGGTSAIYKRTTNPHTTIGDGLALAYNAGCEIADMEFIQFHPSAICTDSEEAFLISEAVRGEGARLINQNGERFMPAIHELAELAPRDIVAQSIYQQMQKYNQDFVWLSLKHLDPELVKHRFPNIYEKCQELGIDMCDRIPVAPAAHYMVGGVRTDINGQTNIKRLFICGELASSGIMGANRLASNSLIECLVFGKRAIEASRSNIGNNTVPVFTRRYHDHEQYAPLYIQLKKDVSRIMTQHAGIIRNAISLQEGLDKLKRLEESLPREENEYYSLISHNLVTVARLIIRSALYRKESRGGHFREDFPTSHQDYLYHIVQQKGKELQTIPINTKKIPS
ncbi:MAG: L-aspartate oxidase [Odoribacter sp.]